MRVTVYLDVFFLWNLGMNVLLLTLAGKVLKQKVLFRKRLAGAAAGAAGAVLLFVRGGPGPLILGYFAGLGLMTGLSFGFYSLRQLAKTLTVMFLVSFCMAGILSGFSELSTGNNYLKQAVCLKIGEKRGNFLFQIFFIGSVLLPLGFVWYFRRGAPSAVSFYYQVTLRYGEQSYCGTGYLDSGNSLVQPLTGIPVILMEAEEMERFLQRKVPTEGELPEENKSWQAIPYHCAGKSCGILWGIRLDELSITKDGEQWRTDRILAAACRDLFSGGSKKQGCTVLLHRSLAKFPNRETTSGTKQSVETKRSEI